MKEFVYKKLSCLRMSRLNEIKPIPLIRVYGYIKEVRSSCYAHYFAHVGEEGR